MSEVGADARGIPALEVGPRSSAPHVPGTAPEAMGLVFGLGCLSARQAAALWPEPISERHARRVFHALHDCGLLERNRSGVLYAPANALWLDVPPARRGRRRWEDLYSLSEYGVRYASDCLNIPLGKARTRYNRSYSVGRREHAYLRNEAYALLAEDAAQDPAVTVADLEAEGGVPRAKLLPRPWRGPRWVEPDGLIRLLDDDGQRVRPATFLVESDTGTQTSVQQIAEKIEGYCEWFLEGSETPEAVDVSGHPPVLFVSPTERRSRAVRGLIQTAAEARQDSPVWDLDDRRREAGKPNGVLDVFCTTNLQALRRLGGLGDAYHFLRDDHPGRLL